MGGIDDMVIDIDPRIKYMQCSTGDKYGTIKVDFKHRGKRVIRSLSWADPGTPEIQVINQMTYWLESFK